MYALSESTNESEKYMQHLVVLEKSFLRDLICEKQQQGYAVMTMIDDYDTWNVPAFFFPNNFPYILIV